jgi:hypothetical protein
VSSYDCCVHVLLLCRVAALPSAPRDARHLAAQGAEELGHLGRLDARTLHEHHEWAQILRPQHVQALGQQGRGGEDDEVRIRAGQVLRGCAGGVRGGQGGGGGDSQMISSWGIAS